jgi:hypothetical protein
LNLDEIFFARRLDAPLLLRTTVMGSGPIPSAEATLSGIGSRIDKGADSSGPDTAGNPKLESWVSDFCVSSSVALAGEVGFDLRGRKVMRGAR